MMWIFHVYIMVGQIRLYDSWIMNMFVYNQYWLCTRGIVLLDLWLDQASHTEVYFCFNLSGCFHAPRKCLIQGFLFNSSPELMASVRLVHCFTVVLPCLSLFTLSYTSSLLQKQLCPNLAQSILKYRSFKTFLKWLLFLWGFCLLKITSWINPNLWGI